VNSYLIADTKPILIDTGLAHDRGPLLNALAGEVDTVLRHLHIVPDRPAWLPDADPVPAALAPPDLLSV
jgi:flavorubredoxin